MLIREMKLGDSASVTKTVTETDVYLFAGITGDLNPAHTNEVSASQTQFGGRIAHGILGAGFISAVLGMKLPGPGTIYLGQELKFTKPVYIGTPSRRPVPSGNCFRKRISSSWTPYAPTSTETW